MHDRFGCAAVPVPVAVAVAVAVALALGIYWCDMQGTTRDMENPGTISEHKSIPLPAIGTPEKLVSGSSLLK